VSTTTAEARTLVKLATPVVITQIGTMLMGVVDIIMVGHVGVDALGGASLGRVWVFGTLLIGMGIVMGIDPIVTQAHGARNPARMGIALQQGMVLALLVSLPIAGLWLLTRSVLGLFGQDAELSRMAEGYVLVQIPAIPFFLFYSVLRSYLQGRAIMRPAMWVAILANVFNVAANWVLIYGHFGFPAMGLVGAGIATAMTRAIMFFGLLAFTLWFRFYEGAWVGWSSKAWNLSGLREVLHYGIPVGLHIGLEIWAFQTATLLSGRLGNEQLAAHIVALNLASLTFMVPLGISIASVTRVGNLIGEGNPKRAQTSAWAALGMGAAVMAVAAVIFIVFRGVLPRIYTEDMGRTRPAAVFNFVGFWVLALPLAWWLAFYRGMGIAGIWWGMVLGLGAVALMLVVWIWRRGPDKVDARVVAGVPSRESPNPPASPASP
jgi:MATE family multidrug resistance protein